MTASLRERQSATAAVYPNPATDFLLLERVVPKSRFSVFNSNGLSVLEITSIDLDKKIDISQLPAGIYHWRMSLPDGRFHGSSFMKLLPYRR